MTAVDQTRRRLFVLNLSLTIFISLENAVMILFY